MYLRSQLQGFAEDIMDSQQAVEFKQGIQSIEFDEDGLCVSGAIDIPLAHVRDLREEFKRRHHEFLTVADLERLQEME